MKWILTAIFIMIFNVIGIISIGYFFVIALGYPEEGCFNIIYGSLVLLGLSVLLFLSILIQRKVNSLHISTIKRYIIFTIRYILICISAVSVFISIILFFITLNNYYILNMGGYIAFIMIILLIEVTYKILLPLAGVEQAD